MAAKEKTLLLVAALCAAAQPAAASIPPRHELLRALAADAAAVSPPPPPRVEVHRKLRSTPRFDAPGRFRLFPGLETRLRVQEYLHQEQPQRHQLLRPQTAVGSTEARYYDPEVGRFLSEDPLEGTSDTPPSLHRYLYGYANPTVFSDPTGRETESLDPQLRRDFNELIGASQELRPGQNAPPGTIVVTFPGGSRIAVPVRNEEDEETKKSLWERATNHITEAYDAAGTAIKRWPELFDELTTPESSIGDEERDFEIATQDTGLAEMAEQTKEVVKTSGVAAYRTAEYAEAATGAGSIAILVKNGIVRVAKRREVARLLRAGWDLADNRVATKTDSAFFWSGRTDDIGGEAVAREIADARSGKTLEAIVEQRRIKMPAWNPSDPESVRAWEKLSRDYAASASGEVRAVVGESLRPGNLWETIELPALKNNPNVSRITKIDPATGLETVIFTRK